MSNTKYIIVKSEKNVGVGILLVVLFGAAGLLYSSVRWGLIMLGVTIFMVVLYIRSYLNYLHNLTYASLSVNGYEEANGLFGRASTVFLVLLAIIWVVCIIISVDSINSYNEEINNIVNNQETE